MIEKWLPVTILHQEREGGMGRSQAACDA